MAWSLVDRTDPTRPLQVTCTLVVRWWASSLRCSPPGCTGCAAELAKRSPPVRVLRASARTTAHNTHDLARPRRRHHLDDDETTNAHEEDHQKTTMKPSPHDDNDLAPCAPLYPPVPTPRSSLFIAPPLFPAPAGSFQKRGVPSRPPRRTGAERIILGPGPRRSIPPKSGPHPT